MEKNKVLEGEILKPRAYFTILAEIYQYLKRNWCENKKYSIYWI